MPSITPDDPRPSPPAPIMVIDVAADGSGSAPRAMTADEYRFICEEIVFGLLEAGIDVRAWMDDDAPS